MSNFAQLGNARRGQGVPTLPHGRQIADYGNYLEAQRAVDFLSDEQFPVQHVTIVGTDLRMVERVTGRLTYGRVAAAGAASGAWFGLFVGVLLTLTAEGASLMFPAVLFGAGFGVLFGVISFALTGGRRDFTSTSQIVALRYAILCVEEQAVEAAAVLARLPHLAGAAPTPPPAPTAGPVAEPPRAAPGGPTAPAAGVAPPPATPTGPTYGEMMERQRRERAEREAHEEHEEHEAGPDQQA